MYQFIFKFNICIPDLSANIKSKREKIFKQKSKLHIEVESKVYRLNNLFLEFELMFRYYNELLNVNSYNIDFFMNTPTFFSLFIVIGDGFPPPPLWDRVEVYEYDVKEIWREAVQKCNSG